MQWTFLTSVIKELYYFMYQCHFCMMLVNRVEAASDVLIYWLTESFSLWGRRCFRQQCPHTAHGKDRR